MGFCISAEGAPGILMGIALSVWTTLGNIDIVTLSGPPTHGREVRFRLFILSLISSGSVL